MRVNLIRIGNSQGLRLPKAILMQCGFEKSVEIRVEGNNLIITPISDVRSGWDEAFQTMAAASDDMPLLEGDIANAFDESEWTW